MSQLGATQEEEKYSVTVVRPCKYVPTSPRTTMTTQGHMGKVPVAATAKSGMSLLGGVQLLSFVEGEVLILPATSKEQADHCNEDPMPHYSFTRQVSAPRQEGEVKEGLATQSIFPSLLQPAAAEHTDTLA